MTVLMLDVQSGQIHRDREHKGAARTGVGRGWRWTGTGSVWGDEKVVQMDSGCIRLNTLNATEHPLKTAKMVNFVMHILSQYFKWGKKDHRWYDSMYRKCPEQANL